MIEILMEKEWLKKMKEEFFQPYMKDLQSFLQTEIEGEKKIYPSANLIFNAFCQTPFSQVKVVIVGQDPYHGEGQAEGLCFSVPKNITPPPSLKNIFKELAEDIHVPIPKSGCLISWAKQGVFLLNATLTVREKEPLSHYGRGWEKFTDRAIEILAEREDPIVFLLWGKSAQEKCQKILEKKRTHHLILKAAHPSFFSASGFFGCKHFSKTNEFLEKHGKKPIAWRIAD
jgi:uracil-DNA glycosylase